MKADHEKRGVMAACDWNIESLKTIRKAMLDIGNQNQKVAWGVGSILVALSSNLLSISQKIINESVQTENPSMSTDLKEIQSQFNEFMEQMLNPE